MTAAALSKLLANAPVGLCAVDPRGVISWVNNQLLGELRARPPRTDGLALAEGATEVIGLPLFAWFEPDEELALAAVLREIGEGLRASARLEIRSSDAGDQARLLLVGVGGEAGGALCMVERFGCTTAPGDATSVTDEATEESDQRLLEILGAGLRQPIDAALGLGALLEQTPLDADQSRLVTGLRASVDDVSQLFDDVIALVQLRDGDLELRDEPLELEELLTAVAARRARVAGSEVEVVVAHAPASVGGLRGDPVRTAQVVDNLVANALRHTQRGHVLISAEVASETRQHVQLKIAVEDTERGRESETLRALFSSTSHRVGGAPRVDGGVGAVLARELTRRMGGSVGATNEPGVGSTSWVQLPVARDMARPHRATRNMLRGLRVMIADRCEARRYALRATLGREGVVVSVSSSGRTGLQAVLQARALQLPFEVLLVGDRLDDMSGDGFARVLRADGAIGSMVMVRLVPVDRQIPARRLAMRGYAASLRQPVRQSELLSLLADLPVRARVEGGRVPPPLLDESDAPPRVLVIADASGEGAATAQMLRRLGCEVTEVSAEQDVTAKFGRAAFDLVLVSGDVRREQQGMPSTIRRQLAGAADVPIVSLAATSRSLAGASMVSPQSVADGRKPRSRAVQQLIERLSSRPGADRGEPR